MGKCVFKSQKVFFFAVFITGQVVSGHQKQAISAPENIWKSLESEMSKYRNTPCGDLSMSLTIATTA